MASSTYSGSTVRKHRRTSNGPKARHSKGWLGNFLASFSKSTPGYGGRHRNDRQGNHTRGVGHL
jgi:hypothetical protein